MALPPYYMRELRSIDRSAPAASLRTSGGGFIKAANKAIEATTPNWLNIPVAEVVREEEWTRPSAAGFYTSEKPGRYFIQKNRDRQQLRNHEATHALTLSGAGGRAALASLGERGLLSKASLPDTTMYDKAQKYPQSYLQKDMKARYGRETMAELVAHGIIDISKMEAERSWPATLRGMAPKVSWLFPGKEGEVPLDEYTRVLKHGLFEYAQKYPDEVRNAREKAFLNRISQGVENERYARSQAAAEAKRRRIREANGR